MTWLTELVKILPAIKSKLQLTGLVVGIAGLVAVRVAAPDAVVAQICAGAIGVLFLVFGQIFQAIPHFPEQDRVRLVITLFVTFLVFTIVLVVVVGYSLNAARSYKGTEVSVGISEAISFAEEVPLLNKKYNVLIFFSSKCADDLKQGMIQPNSTSADDMKQYLEQLQYRIQTTKGAVADYSVKQKGASYEIVCH